MQLILASRNKKKIREVEAILATHFPGVHILSLDDVGYVGDIEENGETYEENALTKARTAVEAGGNRYAAIADDSGLSVDSGIRIGLVFRDDVFPNEIAEDEGIKSGIKHLPSDFKKKNGYKRSTELSRQYGLYRQDYCGCIYSVRDKN